MLQHAKKCTEKLAIQYPIIQAPMAGGATTPELVAAVSNAGGLGSFAAGYLAPDAIRNAIEKIRELTDRPFAVNLFIPEAHHATPEQMQKACHHIQQCCAELATEIKLPIAPYAQAFESQIQVVFEEKVPVFSFTFGMLDSAWIKRLKSNGTLLIGTATTLQEAYALEASGIDLIVAQGSEAGGHRGTFLGKAEDALIGLFSLIPSLAKPIKMPIIAAGGIMDGRAITAAINLGATGVQMGTAFLTCVESGIHKKYKEILLSQAADHTVLTRAFSGKLARGIRNQFIRCMQANAAAILDYPIQNALTQAMRKKAQETNNPEFMSLWAGQSAWQCQALPAKDLIHQLIAEIAETCSADY